MLEAVIFDLDGTIVDTEKIAMEVTQRVLRDDHGIVMEDDEYAAMIGISWLESFTLTCQKNGIDPNIAQQAFKKIISEYLDTLDSGVVEMPGARRLISELKYPLAIVSGSTREMINIILDPLEIKDRFKVIIGAEDVINGKPDPEGFLLAAEKLNVQPQNCLVLEDSPAGIQAAKTAGMKVVAVSFFGFETLDYSDADMTISTLEELDATDIENLYD